jgi:hypothetical protein
VDRIRSNSIYLFETYKEKSLIISNQEHDDSFQQKIERLDIIIKYLREHL